MIVLLKIELLGLSLEIGINNIEEVLIVTVCCGTVFVQRNVGNSCSLSRHLSACIHKRHNRKSKFGGNWVGHLCLCSNEPDASPAWGGLL